MLKFKTLEEAIKELSKDSKNVSMNHRCYRGTGLLDTSIKLNGEYPMNHNVKFIDVIIGNDENDMYDVTVNCNKEVK